MTDTIPKRDHGGGIDAAASAFGGAREDWLDLSTGINPIPFPIGDVSADAWTALPDRAATDRFITAARGFWSVPDGAAILPAPGASALIARLPHLVSGTTVHIPGPTYNEHAASFSAAGWTVVEDGQADALVRVHPNNPDGRRMPERELGTCPATIIDESFCDTVPEASLTHHAAQPRVVILKSFGKFWGLAGLRLGVMIAVPEICEKMAEALGPWPVSGPALDIGARALEDRAWAETTRQRLARDTVRLDAMMATRGAELVGGTTLFRTYAVEDAARLQTRLARAQIWTRIFPYSTTWIRLGLPGGEDDWHRLWDALR